MSLMYLNPVIIDFEVPGGSYLRQMKEIQSHSSSTRRMSLCQQLILFSFRYCESTLPPRKRNLINESISEKKTMPTICYRSLFLLATTAITIAVANGFSTLASPTRFPALTTMGVATESQNDFGSAMPEEVDPHDIIGVEPEKLAIGINATEFLERIGT